MQTGKLLGCAVPCAILDMRCSVAAVNLLDQVMWLWCSLAIMTDAAHLLSDVSGFGVAVFAGYYAAKKSQSTHTFG